MRQNYGTTICEEGINIDADNDDTNNNVSIKYNEDTQTQPHK